MKGLKTTVIIMLVVLAVLLAALAGLMVTNARNYVIDGQLYPKDSEQLDLRGQEITFGHYETVRQVLPECQILWDVPIGGTTASSDSRELAVDDLSELMALLGYFPELETVDISACGDLSLLPRLREQKPDLKLRFAMTVDGNTYTQDSREVTLRDVGEVELLLLSSMENLQCVTVTEGGNTACIPQLKEYCAQTGVKTQIVLNGQPVTGKALTLEAVTEDQARLLMLAMDLETLHLVEPEARGTSLQALKAALTDTAVTWEKTVMGIPFPSDAAQIDLTDVISREEGADPKEKTGYAYALEYPVMGDREENPTNGRLRDKYPLPDKFHMTDQLLAELEVAMEYFPEAEKLVLCGAWLDNDAMAEFRELHREDYKTVWSVRCGAVVTRTDATFFIPIKYGVQAKQFTELDAYNLRYCEDMECIDIGHSAVSNLDFAEFMPNLKYLVTTLSYVKDLDPLVSCKNLVFLEISLCPRITDYSPLLECSSIRDLDISHVYGDITPVLEMDWLDHLWLGDYNEEVYTLAKEALPGVKVGYNGGREYRWRDTPNYYAMRDALLMFYMP